MCSRKGERRCPELVAIREAARLEWTVAETFEEVQTVWRRLGGKVVLHRYGPQHFSLLARHRWGDPEALPLLASRISRRR